MGMDGARILAGARVEDRWRRRWRWGEGREGCRYDGAPVAAATA